MKSKTKDRYVADVKEEKQATLQKGIIFTKDAELKTLYRTNYKNPSLMIVIKKDVSEGLHTVIIWAEYLREWLELRVADRYELCTTTKMLYPILGMAPTEADIEYGMNYDKRFARAARKAEKQAGKKTERKTAVAKTKNIDPVTGFRLGTNKCAIGAALLSCKDAKKVMVACESLIIGFLKEKGKDTSDKKFVHSHTMGYIKWACADNPGPFTEILAALEVILK